MWVLIAAAGIYVASAQHSVLQAQHCRQQCWHLQLAGGQSVLCLVDVLALAEFAAAAAVAAGAAVVTAVCCRESFPIVERDSRSGCSWWLIVWRGNMQGVTARSGTGQFRAWLDRRTVLQMGYDVCCYMQWQFALFAALRWSQNTWGCVCNCSRTAGEEAEQQLTCLPSMQQLHGSHCRCGSNAAA